MHRLSETLLPILLALLLGLAPLQNAWAAVVSSPDQGGHPQQMAAMDLDQDEMSMDRYSGEKCDPCDVDDCCGGLGCSAGQCGSSFIALPSRSLQLPEIFGVAQTEQVTIPSVSTSISPFYRPPRS